MGYFETYSKALNYISSKTLWLNLCYWNFPLDFVPLWKDWALVKAETLHKQKKLHRFQTISFRVTMLICNTWMTSVTSLRRHYIAIFSVWQRLYEISHQLLVQILVRSRDTCFFTICYNKQMYFILRNISWTKKIQNKYEGNHRKWKRKMVTIENANVSVILPALFIDWYMSV